MGPGTEGREVGMASPHEWQYGRLHNGNDAAGIKAHSARMRRTMNTIHSASTVTQQPTPPTGQRGAPRCANLLAGLVAFHGEANLRCLICFTILGELSLARLFPCNYKSVPENTHCHEAAQALQGYRFSSQQTRLPSEPHPQQT